jgi:hypothetical protein
MKTTLSYQFVYVLRSIKLGFVTLGYFKMLKNGAASPGTRGKKKLTSRAVPFYSSLEFMGSELYIGRLVPVLVANKEVRG